MQHYLLQSVATYATIRFDSFKERAMDHETIKQDYLAGDIAAYVAAQALMDLFGWDARTAREEVEFWGKSRGDQ